MPSLERRKVQVAGKSLSVTLPAGWCRFSGLKAGDEVEIITNGDLLIRLPSSVKSTAIERQEHER
jgi:hypothetical protein